MEKNEIIYTHKGTMKRFPSFIDKGNPAGCAEREMRRNPEAFCVFSEKPEYLVFPSYGDYAAWVVGQPENLRYYHEVITESMPQKLKFDIDAEAVALAKYKQGERQPAIEPALARALASKSGKFQDLCGRIAETISDLFTIEYGREPEFIVCESTDSRRPIVKYSRHLIIDGYYVTSTAQAYEFTKRLLSVLPADCLRFLDNGVNKRFQHFRLPGCTKRGEDRVKRVISDHSAADAVVTNVVGLVQLPDIAISINSAPRTTVTGSANDVIEIFTAAGLNAHHRFRMRRDDMYIFNRTAPSMCEFCKRIHDKDNTLLLMCTKPSQEGIIDVMMSCRKYNSENVYTARKIGHFFGNGASDDDTDAGKSRMEVLIERGFAKSVEVCGETLRGVEYDEPALRSFELCDSLIVHAAMKMGKTKKLREYINAHFPADSLVPPVIRFVSFRQTFASNIKESFPDFTLYSDVRGDILTHPRLIVQVESLHRIEVTSDPPDLLILDESESIFEQFESGLIRRFSQACAKFIYMLKYAKHVICMDANITSRTVNILKKIREKPIFYHHNTHKNATEYEYQVTSSGAVWATLLDRQLRAGARVAVPVSSLNMANTIADIMRRRHPTLNIAVYSSETEQSVKAKHFANVNEWWSKYDVVIYTPTVTAGVSFESAHFHHVFGYFTDMSCCDLSCIQMLGRIRDVAARQVTLCIVATGADLPTEIDEIVQLYYDRRACLFAPDNGVTNGVSVEYSGTGEIVLNKSPYFHIWAENVRARNLSKNNFTARLLGAVSRTGARIRYIKIREMSETMLTAVGAMRDEIVEASERDLAQKNELIAQAPDVDSEQIQSIHDTMEQGGTVSQSDINTLRKYALRSHYQYEGQITGTWVRTYGSKRIRDIYKNLCQAGHGDARTIGRLRSTEAAVYIASTQLDESYNHVDIHRKYTYVRHRYARDLLAACGFTDGIYDRRTVHWNTILPDHGPTCDLLRRAAREFEISPPGHIVGTSALNEALINITVQVLLKMYGFTIDRGGMMMKIKRPARFVYPTEQPGDPALPVVVPTFTDEDVIEYDD